MMLAIKAYKKHSETKKQEKLELENKNPDKTSDTADIISLDSVEDSKRQRRLDREKAYVAERKKHLKKQLMSLSILLIVDVAIPLVLYYTLQNKIGAVYALLVSGIPPLLQVIVGFIINRKIHALGCLIVIAFVISAVVSIITGDARIAVLRESVITGIVGILFLITSVPFHYRKFTNRPLVYLISQQMFSEFPPITWTDKSGMKHEVEIIEWLVTYYRPLRIYIYLLNVLWGIGLCGECVARIVMIEATNLSINDIVKYGTIIVATVSSVLGVYSAIHSSILRRRSQKFLHNWLDENDFSHEFASVDQNQDTNNNTTTINTNDASEV